MHAEQLPQACLVQPACRAAAETCTSAGLGKVLKHPSDPFRFVLHLVIAHHPISVWLMHVPAAHVTYEAGGFAVSFL